MEQSNYARIFKALSNEQRLRIFMMLHEQSLGGKKDAPVFPEGAKACCPVEKAFTKMCSLMNLSRSTISHHFKELQAAGLITCERDGQKFRCRVNEEALGLIREFLK